MPERMGKLVIVEGENDERSDGKIVKREEIKQEGEDDEDRPLAFSNAKIVKKDEIKQEDEDDEDNRPLSLSKVKKRKLHKPSEAKKEELDMEDRKKFRKKEMAHKKAEGKSNAKPSNVKKEETEDDDDGDEEKMDKKKKKKKKKKNKEEDNKVVGKAGKKAASQGKVKKERKVYDLPGQKHDPPPERDPLRIFYESLYQQVPNSEMAAFWMMEWGLLPLEEATKVYGQKLMKNQQQKLGSPVKVVSIKKISTVSVKQVKKTTLTTVVKGSKKRKASDSEVDDEDDDFTVPKKKIKK